MHRFGFSVENIHARAIELIDYYKNDPAGVPSLHRYPIFPVLGHKH